jgi:hypothetical protein
MTSYILLKYMIVQPEVVEEATRAVFVSIPRKLNKDSTIRRSTMVLLILITPLLAACDSGPSQDEIEDFVADALPALAQWDPKALQPYSTSEAKEVFLQPDQAKIFRIISRLGDLISFEPPTTLRWSMTTKHGYSSTVQIKAKFTNGDAVVKLGLVYRSGKIKLQQFHFDSPLFLELIDPASQKKI